MKNQLLKNRKKIDLINKELKLLLDEYIMNKGVVLINDRFERDEVVHDFLCHHKTGALIHERNKISLNIGLHKDKMGIPVFDKVREDNVIHDFLSGVDQAHHCIYDAVMKALMYQSKCIQIEGLSKRPSYKGEVVVNSDKSLTHRLLILSSLAVGKTMLKGNFSGLDIYSTIKCLRQLGVEIHIEGGPTRANRISVFNPNAPKFTKPKKALDAGNSGTTMRMLCGLLVGQDFECEITGDASLLKRPMDRVIKPLKLMGADIKCADDLHAPININKKRNQPKLHSINYKMPVPSAQVKTAIMLADLYSEGQSIITGAEGSRDHTDLLLSKMGSRLPLNSLKEANVPGDISSAAFYIALSILSPHSQIIINNVLLNKTRTAYLDVLEQMGAPATVTKVEAGVDISGDISYETSRLNSVYIDKNSLSSVIDEIPILSVIAGISKGKTTFESPDELKVKESDRLQGLITNLSKAGVKIDMDNKGNLVIEGHGDLKHSAGIMILDSKNDHRMVMTYQVLALVCGMPCEIKGWESVYISNPDFFENICFLF